MIKIEQKEGRRTLLSFSKMIPVVACSLHLELLKGNTSLQPNVSGDVIHGIMLYSCITYSRP